MEKMPKDVVLVFELTTDIHWMKDVVQLPVALAKLTGGKVHAIVRPNHKQSEINKHIKLHYQGKELNDNYYCFENSDFSKVLTDPIWYQAACKKAATIGEIMVLYNFFGNPLKGAMKFKLKRWLRFKNALVILKSDGTLSNWLNDRVSFKKRIFDYLKYFFIDSIVCENKNTYTKLKETHHHLFSKIVFIPNCPLGIYHLQVVTPFENRSNTFLFVGRISDKEKGADILLKVWLKIYKKLSGWKLQLIGPCSEDFKKYWMVKLSDEEATKSVIWTPMCSPNELLIYYNNSKIVVCSSRKESGPIILSEASLSGCAFIGTDVGEIPNVLEGLLGLAKDSKDLEEMMLLFANNLPIAKQQASELYKSMQNRNWDEQVKKIRI